MKKTLILFLGCLLAFLSFSPKINSSNDKIKDIKINGYITQVNSPTSFEIDDYRVTMEGKYDIELENIESKAIKFDPAQHIKVGTFVRIKGKVNKETLETSLKEIKIDFKQFRKISQTVVLDATPINVKKNPDGLWSGEVLADGRKIILNETTVVKYKLNKSEEKEAKEAKKNKEKEENKSENQNQTDKENSEKIKDGEEKVFNKSEEGDFEDEESIEKLLAEAKPLNSLDDIVPGVYMTYKGTENLNGSVVASEVVFVKNEKSKDEAKMWKELRIKEKEAKKANSFASLKVGDTKYKVLNEKEVQDYINALGETLIPKYQRNLPDDDENKIPFRFVVIYEKGFNASAYPTGTIVVNHDVFNYLENEAQLAFLLSHEIAHATQEHAIRQQNQNKNTRTALAIGRIFASAMGYGLIGDILLLTEAAMVNGYRRSSENQADRVGMSNMIENGYDPREAPRTWKVVSLHEGNMPTNFFWSGHSSNSERRSYLMLTLRNTYADLGFSSFKKDSDEFQKIAEIVKQKYPKKKK